MTTRHRVLTVACAALLLALPACQNVKKELGVGRNSPDEFAVVKRAPLTMPPNYDLRPPGTASAPESQDSAVTARTVVLGAQPETPQQRAGGENALLARMGAPSADPQIRARIDHDNGIIALQNKSVRDKLIFWKDAADDDIIDPATKLPPSTVDAAAEAERLKKNEAEGKPVNEGDVPVIEKKKGTFDKIFD